MLVSRKKMYEPPVAGAFPWKYKAARLLQTANALSEIRLTLCGIIMLFRPEPENASVSMQVTPGAKLNGTAGELVTRTVSQCARSLEPGRCSPARNHLRQ